MKMMRHLFLLVIVVKILSSASAFVPLSIVESKKRNVVATTSRLHVFDPSFMLTAVTPKMLMMDTSNVLLAASGQKSLSGTLFQVSLLPYLVFLYFLGFRANRLPDLANFGFQFVLLFVFVSIPAGILCKTNYGVSLSDVDWIHGGAESLLTIANIMIVLGMKETMANPDKPRDLSILKTWAFATVLAVAVVCAIGTTLGGVDAHAPFLFGIGNLSNLDRLPWTITHAEPVNALSIPTWIIHYASTFEYLLAMNLVWNYSETTDNERWKGLTWGMLPLFAGGICALTNHFFYNSLQSLVLIQGWLTLFGNTTCALAAFRIARSNGWTIGDSIASGLFFRSNTDPNGLVPDEIAARPLQASDAMDNNVLLGAKLVFLILACSYATKYGELGLDFVFAPNSFAALAIVLGITSTTAFYYWNRSKDESLV